MRGIFGKVAGKSRVSTNGYTLSAFFFLENVKAYADVFVLDTLGGLVTGAMAERMVGDESVCNTYSSLKVPPMDVVRIFNFDVSTSS